MKLFEFKISKGKTKINAVSVVESPAILTNFVKLSAEEQKMRFAVDKMQRIILGPTLIPNIKIYRNAESLGNTEGGYIFFSAETIKELSEQYMSDLKLKSSSLEHEIPTDELCTVESWIIEDPKFDKSVIYGFDLPKSTWMLSMRVNSEKIWQEVLDGTFNGFSIEASGFDIVQKGEVQMSKDTLEESLSDLLLKIIEESLV